MSCKAMKRLRKQAARETIGKSEATTKRYYKILKNKYNKKY